MHNAETNGQNSNSYNLLVTLSVCSRSLKLKTKNKEKVYRYNI